LLCCASLTVCMCHCWGGMGTKHHPVLCHAMLCLYVLCPPGVLESLDSSAVMVQQHCAAGRFRGQAELPTMPAQGSEGRRTQVSDTLLSISH
jgi:hypothetical protein